jgi:hypothetical protein
MAFTYSTTLKNTRMDAITAAIGTSGKLKIYTASAATLLVTLPLSATAAPAASNGVLTFNSIAPTAAVAAGTAAYARLTKSDDTVVVDALTVGAAGANINLQNIGINSGQVITINSLTITHP